jgi:hypothetical protein
MQAKALHHAIVLSVLLCTACAQRPANGPATPAGKSANGSVVPPAPAASNAKPAASLNTGGANAMVSVDVHLDYIEMQGRRYRSADALTSVASGLPPNASVLVKSSLNGTTAQSRKTLDERTAAVVAALQKGGVKHILLKQSILLRS